MNARATTWLAWSLFGLYGLTVAAALGLILFGSGTSDDAVVLLAFGYAAVGALVASREPANAIGWLLLATAVWFGVSDLAWTYPRDPGLPGVVAAAWFSNWSIYVPFCLATMLLPLLFPTGRLVSPRWRPAVAVVIAALALSIVGTALVEGPFDVRAGVAAPINPLGVGGALGEVVLAILRTGQALMLIGVVLGAVSLVVRLRGSRGRERHQLKLLAYVVVALLLCIPVLALVGTFSGPTDSTWAQDLGWTVMVLLVIVGLPLAIGIAILRHRLYDIDVVINRTLVYGALTVTLVVSYLGLFLLLERLVLGPVTSDSDLAVAGSTLVVAALSRPARTRIQAAVDRRFYRQRYDAARTLEAFSSQLRDELDLDTLAADLRHVTQETLRPVHVSLWLREAGR